MVYVSENSSHENVTNSSPEAPNSAGAESVSRRARKADGTAKKSRAPKIILWSILGVVLVVGAVAGIYVWQLISGYNQSEKLAQNEVFPDADTRPEPVARPENTDNDPLNILLLGSDTRDQVGEDLADIRGQRSDTIMVVNVPADRESVNIMSLMRDNWVEIPGHGMAKINAAMSYGGVPLTVQTVESILDVPIDHVAIIDFDGFKGLTDALGGVTVDNKVEFTARHGGAYFPVGEITLNGEDALSYVRERYAFPNGDYTRVANQQRYLKGLMNTLLSRDTLTNPITIMDSVNAISPYLTVDDALTPTALAPLGMSLSGIRSGDINMFTSPTLGTGMVGAQSVVHPDWEGLEKLAELFREDRVSEWKP